MALRTLFNLFYTGLFHLHTASHGQPELLPLTQQFLKEMEVDSFLIKLITLTLEVHYLPIKKLTILYARVLSILFGMGQFYEDGDLFRMASDNLLPEDYLRLYKEKNNPRDVAGQVDPVLQFYVVFWVIVG